MGKDRRQRQKFHISPKNAAEKSNFDTNMDTSQPILIQPTENLFAGIKINLDGLKNDLLEDTRNTKSETSNSNSKVMLKKDKIKLRRDMLMKKFDTIKQLKMENKRRSKRKNVSIIGDTNPLHDALPSLESLLATRSSNTNNIKKESQAKPKKGIEKALKRKKQLVQGVEIFKKLMANKDFQKNPLQIISKHVEAVVTQENAKIK